MKKKEKEKGDLIGIKQQQMCVDAFDDRSIHVCNLCDLCRGWSPGCWPGGNNEGCTHKKETMFCSKGTASCATHVITVKLGAVLRALCVLGQVCCCRVYDGNPTIPEAFTIVIGRKM